MKKKMSRWSIALGGAALGIATAADTPPDASTVIVGTPAVLLTRSVPEYPRSEVIHNKEGWLLVSYDITAEGRVSDVVILDQVGPKPFADAGRRKENLSVIAHNAGIGIRRAAIGHMRHLQALRRQE